MLSKEKAREIAVITIAELAKNWNQSYVILEDEIIEKEFAWVFPFNTSEYARTKDILDMAIGIGPVVINRKSGVATVAPPMPIQQYLRQYEANLE